MVFKMPFKKGENGGATGGARPGAGRPPNEFREWLGDLIHSPKARKRFEKILNDEQDAETLVTSEGVEVPTRAKGVTYLQAYELGLAYEKGKPNQPLSNPDGSPFAGLPTDAVAELVDVLRQRIAGKSDGGTGEAA